MAEEIDEIKVGDLVSCNGEEGNVVNVLRNLATVLLENGSTQTCPLSVLTLEEPIPFIPEFRVVKVRDDRQENCGFFESFEQARKRFINVVADTISNFDEYTSCDIEAIVENRIENFGSGYVAIVTL